MAAAIPRDRRGPHRRTAAALAAVVMAVTALGATGVAVWRHAASGGNAVVVTAPRSSLDVDASGVARRIFPSIAVQISGDGRWYDATVLGADAEHDVALLQLSGASGLPVIPYRDSSSLAVGDGVVMAGNALGIGGTPDVAAGVVTAMGQSIGASDADGTHHISLDGMIEVRASIQEGDSGGPLMDREGHVVGMMTAHLPDEDPPLCYSIPIERALGIAQRFAPSLSLADAW